MSIPDAAGHPARDVDGVGTGFKLQSHARFAVQR
jgi:hypothetical protein